MPDELDTVIAFFPLSCDGVFQTYFNSGKTCEPGKISYDALQSRKACEWDILNQISKRIKRILPRTGLSPCAKHTLQQDGGRSPVRSRGCHMPET